MSIFPSTKRLVNLARAISTNGLIVQAEGKSPIKVDRLRSTHYDLAREGFIIPKAHTPDAAAFR